MNLDFFVLLHIMPSISGTMVFLWILFFAPDPVSGLLQVATRNRFAYESRRGVRSVVVVSCSLQASVRVACSCPFLIPYNLLRNFILRGSGCVEFLRCITYYTFKTLRSLPGNQCSLILGLIPAFKKELTRTRPQQSGSRSGFPLSPGHGRKSSWY